MKYSVITFGCRVNQADSLGFEEELRAGGAEAASPDQADLVVVNTCSVTGGADQGARQTIRRVARANPNARILVTGCYATRRPDEVRGLPNVVAVLANDDKPRFIDVVRRDRVALDDARTRGDLSTAERYGNGEGSCGSAIEPGVAGRTAFTLRVQTGCAEPCAYCIIPSTRGTPRSVAPDVLLAEIDRVVSAGFKEIALTGVHLGSYGRDLTPGSSLIDLLTRITGSAFSHAPGAPPPLALAPRRSLTSAAGADSLSSRGPQALFRISSLEPMDCTREIVDLVATTGRFAPHFHLPLQHASDRVLARMRRPYTLDCYAALVDSIRARLESASIGSDIIVGFPGESDADFEHLASYLAGSPLTHLHVFPYSDRPGTEAAGMDGKVPGAVIRERGRRLREIGQRLTSRFRESQLGTVHRGLTLEDGSLVVTGNYLKVRIPPGRVRNEWVRVKVTSAGETLRGEVVES